jgi:hypothetical protein
MDWDYRRRKYCCVRLRIHHRYMVVFFSRALFQFAPRCLLGESRFHEAAMSNETLNWVWTTLGADPEASSLERRRQELFAAAAFDYAILNKDYKGVHEWLFRRWSAFNIAANSLWALYLSLPFGLVVGIRWTGQWWVPVVLFSIVLIPVMIWAWRDTMDMLEFMARLLSKKNEPQKGSEAEDS